MKDANNNLNTLQSLEKLEDKLTKLKGNLKALKEKADSMKKS